MRHPVLPGVAERGDRLKAQGAGEVLELTGPDSHSQLVAAPAGSADTIVFTHTLCAVADVVATLAEAERVLAPEGRLLLVEHVRTPGVLGRMQDAWAPFWKRSPVGCTPNREPIALLRAAGFAVIDCDRFTTRGIPILSRYVAAVAIRQAQAPTKDDDVS